MTTLLVVDDESLVTDFLSFLLEREGYTVLSAKNGKEALAVLARTCPDLVITDLMMPVMSGLELAQALRLNDAWMHLPVILCSAAPGALADEDRQHFVAIVQKPYPAAALLDVVARHSGLGKGRGDSANG